MTAIRPAIRSAIQPAIRSAFAGSYGWLPTSLFAAGEQGVWYDPSDLSTMFQDVAGTVPVTADGQLVARINDKSGRGNHATQATEASRPLYKTSGGLHWLQFDGTDDFLHTAAIDFSARDEMSVFTGVHKANDTAAMIAELSANAGANAGSFYLVASESAGTFDFQVRGSAIITGTRPNVSGYPAPVSAVMSAESKISTDLKRLRVNAGAYASNSVDLGSGAFGAAYPLYIGRRGGASLPLNGNIYSLIVRGALSDAAQITQVESFVAGNTGVTLP